VLGDLVAASNTQVNATLADEGRDVSSGQEDQGDRQVLDQRDVEAGFTAELDVTAGKEVEGGLLETALCVIDARLVGWFNECMCMRHVFVLFALVVNESLVCWRETCFWGRRKGGGLRGCCGLMLIEVVLAIDIASLFGLTHWLTRSIVTERGAGHGGGAFKKSLVGSIEVENDLTMSSMAN
jgi:hypothetical protein